MYPRMKVRNVEDPKPVEEEAKTYLLKVVESLSIENHSPRIPIAGHGSNGTQSHSNASRSCTKNLTTPPISTSKGMTSKGTYEDKKTNIRASSVPRPRAVLSSPDNDALIGNQNQLLRKREALPKRPSQSTHGQGTADKFTRLPNQSLRKSGTPAKTRPTSQNLQDLVKPTKVNPRIVPPLIGVRKVTGEDGKKTHTVEKYTSKASTQRPRPSSKTG